MNFDMIFVVSIFLASVITMLYVTRGSKEEHHRYGSENYGSKPAPKECKSCDTCVGCSSTVASEDTDECK